MDIKRLFGWLGLTILLLIIPIKMIRLLDQDIIGSILISVAPSILGPFGLLLLILSSSGKLSNLTLFQVTLIVLIIALILEFAQLLPRHGFLKYINYTFNWLDVISSLLSTFVGYFIARLIIKKNYTKKLKLYSYEKT